MVKETKNPVWTSHLRGKLYPTPDDIPREIADPLRGKLKLERRFPYQLDFTENYQTIGYVIVYRGEDGKRSRRQLCLEVDNTGWRFGDFADPASWNVYFYNWGRRGQVSNLVYLSSEEEADVINDLLEEAKMDEEWLAVTTAGGPGRIRKLRATPAGRRGKQTSQPEALANSFLAWQDGLEEAVVLVADSKASRDAASIVRNYLWPGAAKVIDPWAVRGDTKQTIVDFFARQSDPVTTLKDLLARQESRYSREMIVPSHFNKAKLRERLYVLGGGEEGVWIFGAFKNQPIYLTSSQLRSPKPLAGLGRPRWWREVMGISLSGTVEDFHPLPQIMAHTIGDELTLLGEKRARDHGNLENNDIFGMGLIWSTPDYKGNKLYFCTGDGYHECEIRKGNNLLKLSERRDLITQPFEGWIFRSTRRGKVVKLDPEAEVPPERFLNLFQEMGEKMNFADFESIVNFVGWLSLVPVCGALTHRPACWMVSPYATGKTTLVSRVMKPLLGGMMRFIDKTESTIAGVKNGMDDSAIGLVIDELETNRDTRKEVDRLLGMVNSATSESGMITKTAQDNESTVEIQFRFLTFFTSIRGRMLNAASASRFSHVRYMAPGAPGSVEYKANLEGDQVDSYFSDVIEPEILQKITPALGQEFVLASVQRFPLLLEVIKIFERVVRSGDGRQNYLRASLLAGWWVITRGRTLTKAKAEEIWKKYAQTIYQLGRLESAEQRLLNVLLASRVELMISAEEEYDERMSGVLETRKARGSRKPSVRDLIRATSCAEKHLKGYYRPLANDPETIDRELGNYGMRVIWDNNQAKLAIMPAKDCPELSKLLEASREFAGTEPTLQLRSLPGASIPTKTFEFKEQGKKSRAVLIPLEAFELPGVLHKTAQEVDREYYRQADLPTDLNTPSPIYSGEDEVED